jgi:DNA polymerase III epsilon subunit family exonuclease
LPQRRIIIYPHLSRLAHELLEKHNAALQIDELCSSLGLTVHDANKLLPKLLDGRFRFLESEVALWSWTLPFPPNGETIVVLDLEATNGDPIREDIIEVGAVKISSAGIEEFSSLVHTTRHIPPFVVKLTGINQTMVLNARPVEEVLTDFKAFLGDATLIVQNSGFDVALLTREFGKLQFKLSNPVVDTINLALAALPGRRKRGLDALSKLFRVKLQERHRALGDARVTLEISKHLYYSLTHGRNMTIADLHHGLVKPPNNPVKPQTNKNQSQNWREKRPQRNSR